MYVAKQMRADEERRDAPCEQHEPRRNDREELPLPPPPPPRHGVPPIELSTFH